MKSCTVKSLVKKNTFLTFVFLSFFFIGSGMIAASMYRHYSPETSEKVNYDTLQPKKPASVDSLYKASMRKGDNFFVAKEYEKAISEYENGLKLRPKDPYATDRLGKAKKQLETKVKAEMDYVKSIASGDSYFKAKDYLNAKGSYQLAIDAKPDDDYAKGKLKETMDLLRSMKASNILYDVAIASAEKLYQQKEYEKAMAEFEDASKILPNEKYPKDRINEIIKMMVDKQTTEEMYTRSIAAADKLYNSKGYQNALLEYQHAASYKPEEQYPKDRIKELTALLAAMKARDEAYKKSIDTADKLFDDASYEPSKSEYQNASKIKPDEIYPINRIKEIDLIMARLKNAKEEYNRLVDLADSFYVAKKYINAKANYQQALKVKPNESYPKEMISKADNLISGQEANSKALEEAYQVAVSDADKLYTAKEYDKAKSGYQNALGIKPDEQYPKDKIKQIDDIYATADKQKQQDKQYLDIIAAADKLLADKSYQPAKVQYQSALKLKPEEKYPKDRIAEIDLAMTDLAKQKALDDQYTAAIAKADKLFAAKTWEQAKTDYTTASALKPNETYPKDKILEIEKIVADLAKQKALDDQYAGIIANADKLLLAKTYTEARTEYGKAGDLKPSEAYPKTKIAEIDNILAAIEAQKSKDEQYSGLIEKADKLLADKSYEPAKTEYQNASAIKPAESYPKGKIVEINDVLAGIAKKKALDDQYTSTIANADKLLADKSYEPAKVQYQSALKLKPEEKYPQDRIAEIDLALSDLAKQKALDDQYIAAIAKADNSFAAKTWEQAKTDYTAASALKPNETYPKDKISEIQKILDDIAKQKVIDQKYQTAIATGDKLLEAKTYDLARLAYFDASGLKPAEQYPKDKMAQIDKIIADITHQKEIETQYKASIAKADQLLLSKSYEPAKTEYQNAVTLKPDEQYPKVKIAAIDNILADMKAFEDKYNGAIATGDTAFNNKSYAQAKSAYQGALQMKPAEKYPKDKIAGIEKILTELAKQKVIDDQYQGSVTKADKLLADKSYALAKTEYGNASNIKPTEQYPKDKIVEIDGIMADLKAKDDAYKASVAKANQLMVQKSYEEARTEYQNAGEIKPNEQYPKDKIAEINKILMELKGKKQTYDELVSKGNDLLLIKDFYKAKDNFQQALSIFPDESYPKERLIRINSVIDSIFRANKGFYDKAVAEGDKNFNAMVFDKSVDSYEEALSYLPMEQYPKDMINKIKRTIAENAIVDVLNSAQTVTNGVEKQFDFAPVNVISRKNNYLFIKIRNLSNRPFSVMIRYGKDKQINGGAVIKNITGDGKVNERLISVREQDPWYRIDNNWISLYPQGGDVEVTFIQISRSGQ
jgi:tetratricopeptide (TPR) repeat protein